MSLLLATPVFENNGGSQNDNTSISITAADGTAIYWCNYRRSKAVTTAAPLFNGEVFTKILADSIDTGEALLDVYKLVVPSGKGGTYNITSSLSGYAWYNTAVLVVTGTASIYESFEAPQIYTSGTYSEPSITLNVTDGSLVLSFLAGMNWTTGYDAVDATWSSVAPAVNQGVISNASTPALSKLNVQSSVGTSGSFETEWTASVPNSMYTHLVMNVYEGAGAFEPTFDSPIRPGGAGYELKSSLGSDVIVGVTNGTVNSFTTDEEEGSFTVNYDMNPWVNGVEYLPVGDVTNEFTLIYDLEMGSESGYAIELQPPVGFTTVNISGVDTGEFSLGSNANVVNGTQVSWPSSAGTINPNGTLTDFTFGTHACWLRDIDGVMKTFNLIVTEAGQVIIDGGDNIFKQLLPSVLKIEPLKITPLKIF